jgi:hypothetical protein
MNCTHVTNQSELNAALAAHPNGECIHLDGNGVFEVRSSGSSTVTASGSSTVTASGSSTVTAYDSSTVTAYGSSTVTAYDSSTVRAYDSSTVTAYDSSTVRAYGSSTVRASGSSTVRAYDSSTVRAYGSSTVTASKFAVVHKMGPHVTITGAGHVVTPPNLDRCDTATWLSYHGIESDKDGIVTLYKAVDDAYTTSRRFDYRPGATPEAPDWVADHECGEGLHFGPTPVHAMAYKSDATRFMACPIRADEISVIDQQKIKARRVVAPGCREVDIDGRPMPESDPTSIAA